jgi:GNAT superfamily N-acetyltransferase
MVKLTPSTMEQITSLFSGTEETMIRSCLQGVMGDAWADRIDRPTAARISVGDFLFFAGDSNAEGAEELVKDLPSSSRPWRLLIPPNEDWAELIEAVHREKAQRTTRYAFNKDTVFDRKHLEKLRSSLPRSYKIVPFDADIYHSSLSEPWSQDFCSHFADPEDFLSRGIGSAVLYNGRLVGGASSYAIYNGGIEVEIDIREDHRHKGLGTACGSDLILRCLEKGLYPSWDAANLVSVALAKKLGYRLKGPYSAYNVQL